MTIDSLAESSNVAVQAECRSSDRIHYYMT
jgi:hypothetical protein